MIDELIIEMFDGENWIIVEAPKVEETNPEDEVNDIENKDLKKVVDYVIKYFGCYNGHILREFTHNEKTWLDSYQTVDKIIEKSEIKNFGKNIIKKYDIKNLDEIYKYSDSMINKL